MSCYIITARCEDVSVVSVLESGRADVCLEPSPRSQLRVLTDDLGEVAIGNETGSVYLLTSGMHSVDAYTQGIGVVAVTHDDVMHHTVSVACRALGRLIVIESDACTLTSMRQADGFTVKASLASTVRRSKSRRYLFDSIMRRLKDSLGRYILDKR